jgi:hypothetical protein
MEAAELVPEVGIEPTWAQGPLDFESSASTSFTTPAIVDAFYTLTVCKKQAGSCIAGRILMDLW